MSDMQGGRIRQRVVMFWHFLVARFRHGERYGLDFTLAFLGILAAMWVFAELVEGAVSEQSLNSIDTRIQKAMALLLQDRVVDWVVFITNLGGTRGTVIGVLIVGIPLLLRRRWWSAFGLVFATAGGGLVVLGLKAFFARARPVEQIISAGGYAFPSGHAFSAMVFFGFLIFLAYKHLRHATLQVIVTLFSFIMIVLIGLSRVYLNVHWLTDVLGGFFAGFVWLVLSILIVRHVEWPARADVKREKEQEIERRHAEESPPSSDPKATNFDGAGTRSDTSQSHEAGPSERSSTRRDK